MRKTILVLVLLTSLLASVGIINAQTIKPLKYEPASRKILPGSYYFPEGKFGDLFICNGTWMSEKTPYDPINPNISYIECSKYEMNCRISTAYIYGGSLLDLISHYYKVENWTPDLITARYSGDTIYGNSNILVIRFSDKSATIFRLNTKTGESFKEFLKDASNLTKDKTLQEYYYGREMTK